MKREKTITRVKKLFLGRRDLQLVSWAFLSVLVAVSDYFSGPFIQLTFIYIFPVVLATWFNGRRWGLVFAFVQPLIRIFFYFLWTIPWSLPEVFINALIRIIIFSVFVLLVDIEVKRRALAREVKALRGLLPICSFCKKIRTKNNNWVPIEEYIDEHSGMELTHGYCPDCMKEQYGIEPSSQK